MVCFCQQKCFKGDIPVTFIRAEFNQVVLGDSAKITVSPEENAKYNFTSSFEFSPEGGITLDDLAHKPVFCKSLLILKMPIICVWYKEILRYLVAVLGTDRHTLPS